MIYWIFILVFVILLFSLPLSLSFSVTEKRLLICVKVFGIKVFFLDSDQKQKKTQKAVKHKPKKETKSTAQKIDYLRLILEIVFRVLHHVRLLPRIKKLRFLLEFGLSDAAKTGMVAGGIYALVYGIQARLHRSRRISFEELAVTPNFQSPAFALDFSGIITTCLVHIMGIAVVVLAVAAKQKMKEE